MDAKLGREFVLMESDKKIIQAKPISCRRHLAPLRKTSNVKWLEKFLKQ